jgi:hypothetical protein
LSAQVRADVWYDTAAHARESVAAGGSVYSDLPKQHDGVDEGLGLGWAFELGCDNATEVWRLALSRNSYSPRLSSVLRARAKWWAVYAFHPSLPAKGRKAL